MFRFISIFCLFFLSIFLCGCPYESPVALDAKPVESIDTSLLGYWYGIVKDGSDFFGIEALDIKKLSDSTYDIIRYGKAIKGDMILPDTAHFSGYTSHVDGQLYMNVETTVVDVIQVPRKQPIVKTSKAYYLATLDMSNDTLSVKMIADGFSGRNPNFRTPEMLRTTVSSLVKQDKNIFDDVYKLSYRKTERPR